MGISHYLRLHQNPNRQVLRHGHLLVDRNPGRRHDSFGRILGLYEDVKILRREMERKAFRRLRQ